jgi:predicted PurR-regulated permease PerM
MSRFFLDSRTARATWTILVILGVIGLAYAVRGVLLLIALSLFFAYLLFPVVRLTQRWVVQRRSLAIGVVYLVLLAALVGTGIAVGPRLSSEVQSLAQKLPEMSTQIQSGQMVERVLQRRGWEWREILLLVSLAASAWVAAFGKFFSGLLPFPVAVMQTANALLSFVVIGLMFAVKYRLLPDVRLAWRNVWIGAAVTALLFILGKSLIGLYLGRSATASVYGAAGSFIVILLWIYYSAQVFFFGAEFTKVYARHFGVIVVPDPTAVPLTAEARAAQGMDRSQRTLRARSRRVPEGR